MEFRHRIQRLHNSSNRSLHVLLRTPSHLFLLLCLMIISIPCVHADYIDTVQFLTVYYEDPHNPYMPPAYDEAFGYCSINNRTFPVVDSRAKNGELSKYLSRHTVRDLTAFINIDIPFDCDRTYKTPSGCQISRIEQDGSLTVIGRLNADGYGMIPENGQYSNFQAGSPSSTNMQVIITSQGIWLGKDGDSTVSAIICERTTQTAVEKPGVIASSTTHNLAKLIGGVVGGVGGLILLILTCVLIFYCRWIPTPIDIFQVDPLTEMEQQQDVKPSYSGNAVQEWKISISCTPSQTNSGETEREILRAVSTLLTEVSSKDGVRSMCTVSGPHDGSSLASPSAPPVLEDGSSERGPSAVQLAEVAMNMGSEGSAAGAEAAAPPPTGGQRAGRGRSGSAFGTLLTRPVAKITSTARVGKRGTAAAGLASPPPSEPSTTGVPAAAATESASLPSVAASAPSNRSLVVGGGGGGAAPLLLEATQERVSSNGSGSVPTQSEAQRLLSHSASRLQARAEPAIIPPPVRACMEDTDASLTAAATSIAGTIESSGRSVSVGEDARQESESPPLTPSLGRRASFTEVVSTSLHNSRPVTPRPTSAELRSSLVKQRSHKWDSSRSTSAEACKPLPPSWTVRTRLELCDAQDRQRMREERLETPDDATDAITHIIETGYQCFLDDSEMHSI